jgi:hypothetical protein
MENDEGIKTSLHLLREQADSVLPAPKPIGNLVVRRVARWRLGYGTLLLALVSMLVAGGFSLTRLVSSRLAADSTTPGGSVAPSAGVLAEIPVEGAVWKLLVAHDKDGATLQLISPEGNVGKYTLPPLSDELVATSLTTAGGAEMAIVGVIPAEASRVTVQLAGGRSTDATLIQLPAEVSSDYVAYVATVDGPLSAYEVVAQDAQGNIIAQRQFQQPPAFDPPPSG